MTDPLDVLRAPVVPVEPDSDFAARLRARLQRTLTLAQGVAMPTTTVHQSAETSAASTGAGFTPYLAVRDARAALDFYAAALGARLAGDPIVMPGGRIGHAELEVAGARMYVSDEHPEIGVVAPEPGAGATVTLHLEVPDVDALVAQAVLAGARLDREPSDNPYGRIAVLTDPFGHRWMLNSPPTEDRVHQGDVGYLSLWVPDVARAADFFAAVLGWTYLESAGQRRLVVGASPPHGMAELGAVPGESAIWSGQRHATLFRSHAVEDLDAAVQRVRAAGGQADEPADLSHGRSASCVDDQGAPFALHELPQHQAGPRGPRNGAGPGDISYVVYEVPDSARARAFYGSVLGWRFEAGRADDGWQLIDNVPMSGLHGGHERATVVPMYRVDDITAAVRQVRAEGGTATDPHAEPYGLAAECADDQGTRFLLAEH